MIGIEHYYDAKTYTKVVIITSKFIQFHYSHVLPKIKANKKEDQERKIKYHI